MGSIILSPLSVNKVEIGPTISPIRIKGKIAGILNFQE
jgi:hypothetical protein